MRALDPGVSVARGVRVHPRTPGDSSTRDRHPATDRPTPWFGKRGRQLRSLLLIASGEPLAVTLSRASAIEMTRAGVPDAARATRRFAALFLALAAALPRAALASDYEGDYRLYSGHHPGCEEVSYGINRTASDLTGRDESFRDDRVFTHASTFTPSAFNATDASGGSSRTHTLRVRWLLELG